MDNLDYLKPGFDLSSLRVVDLRQVLHDNDVSFRSSVNKQQLIKLVREEVIAKASQTTRHSEIPKKGKEALDNLSSDNADLNADLKKTPARTFRSPAKKSESVRSSPKKKAARSRSPSSSHLNEVTLSEPEAETQISRSPSKSAKTLSSKHQKSTPLKSRKLAQKIHSPIDTAGHLQPDVAMLNAQSGVKRISKSSTRPENGPRRSFSPKNPFQSNLLGGDENVLRQVMPNYSSKSDETEMSENDIRRCPPAYEPFMRDVSSLKASPAFETILRKSFSPESTSKSAPKPSITDLTLKDNSSAHESIKSETTAKMQHDVRNNKRKVERSILQNVLLAIILVTITLSFAIFREQKICIGYCGPTEGSDELTNLLPLSFRPDCAACPLHGICGNKLELNCEEGYRVDDQTLLGRLGLSFVAPWNRFCARDRSTSMKVEMVKNQISSTLKNHADNLKDGADTDLGIEVEKLKRKISELKTDDVSENEISNLINSAIKEMREDMQIKTDPQIELENISKRQDYKIRRYTGHERVFSALRATFGPRMVRCGRVIIGLISLVVLISVLHWKINVVKSERQKQEYLVGLIRERLSLQASIASSNPSKRPYLPSVHIREALLPRYNMSKRISIWNHVSKKIESDSNVRVRNEEIKGEILRVWEWLGSPIDNYILLRELDEHLEKRSK